MWKTLNWHIRIVPNLKKGFVTGQVEEPCFNRYSLIACNYAWERLSFYTLWGLNYTVLFTWCLGTMWYFYEKICRWMIVIEDRFAFNIAPIVDIVIMVAYNYWDHYTCIISIVWSTQPMNWIKLSRSGLQNTNTRDFIIKGPKKRPVNWALTSNCLC